MPQPAALMAGRKASIAPSRPHSADDIAARMARSRDLVAGCVINHPPEGAEDEESPCEPGGPVPQRTALPPRTRVRWAGQARRPDSSLEEGFTVAGQRRVPTR